MDYGMDGIVFMFFLKPRMPSEMRTQAHRRRRIASNTQG